MKHLERFNQCTSSCYREAVSFIDKDGNQVAYQKVFSFHNGWYWLTFFGDIDSTDYPQRHNTLDDMRQYIRTQGPIPEGQKYT